MERYLGFHAGPHGTGYRRKSLSVPLATGGSVHTGIELLASWILDYQEAHQQMPPATLPLEVVAWAATEAAARYETKARARGFTEIALESVGTDLPPGLPGQLPPQVENLILEQRTLIEGILWVYGTLYLPGVLSQYRLINAEVEDALILDCTCGLGDAISDHQLHASRSCTGIVQQARADIIWEGHTGEVAGTLVYDEAKTKATKNAPWEKSWEHSGQLLINMETASRRLGKRIDHAQIITLYKGWRGRDRNAPPDAPKHQHSPLCYGYRDPGAPGVHPAAWAAAYEWEDEYGHKRRLGKTYQRQAIWHEGIELPTPAGVRAEASRVERWVMGYIALAQVPDLLKVLGPFPHQVARVPLAIQAILAEERDWRELVRVIRDHVAEGGSEWEATDGLIPRSWACIKYDGAPCAFKPLCDREPGWDNPLGTGRYEIRTPHHAIEQQAFAEVGIEFPVEPEEEEWEEVEVE
jgi:hypothetical protein